MVLEEKKVYYRKMLMLGIPILCQNLIGIGLNLLDTLMIGILGENQLAAVGAANQVYFVFSIALFGLFSGSAVYTSQYYGARNFHGIRKVLGIDYLIAFIAAAIVCFLSYVFGPSVIGIFSASPVVIELGTAYIRIACFSYIFSAISMAISFNSRAIQRINIPTAINALALLVNGVLNYGFIYGNMGMPELGVRGAAVATLIARIFELTALILYVFLSKDHPFRTGFGELMSFGSDLFKAVMKMALPVVFTETCWAVSTSLIFAAYGKLGTSALAVAQVANVVVEMLQSTYFGVGNATAMLIGEVLGKKRKDLGYSYGVYALQVVAVLNVIVTLVLIFISRPVANIYNFNSDTTALLIRTIITMGFLITPRMFGYIFVVGILRGGGDTVFCMKLELFCNLLIQLPVAYICVLVFHTTLPVAMIIGELGNLIRIIVCIPRFKSKKWLNLVAD